MAINKVTNTFYVSDSDPRTAGVMFPANSLVLDTKNMVLHKINQVNKHTTMYDFEGIKTNVENSTSLTEKDVTNILNKDISTITYNTDFKENLEGGWYTIAVLPSTENNMSYCEFKVIDNATQRHQVLNFKLTYMYGLSSGSSINLLAHGWWSNQVIQAIRIKAYGTKRGAVVQVKINDNNTNKLQVTLINEDSTSLGKFKLTPFISADIDPVEVIDYDKFKDIIYLNLITKYKGGDVKSNFTTYTNARLSGVQFTSKNQEGLPVYKMFLETNDNFILYSQKYRNTPLNINAKGKSIKSFGKYLIKEDSLQSKGIGYLSLSGSDNVSFRWGYATIKAGKELEIKFSKAFKRYLFNVTYTAFRNQDALEYVTQSPKSFTVKNTSDNDIKIYYQAIGKD